MRCSLQKRYGQKPPSFSNLVTNYTKAGLNSDWEAVVADVRKRHYRKKGFMAGFEDIVSGTPRYIEPTFLERAKARWPKK